ncbi:SDR family oxidoreductase [Eilatimonas milleporae]|uniref:NAD(P)-dependent dehydrogenase (Short-subunit alcohol dehydrogenase family) n=1 Tax=Eilatimonas milleporae TaxID=911205 RepID=A0A3M0D6V4_9PROT|nr:SDR family oxidoreductase [Eilatimonas milleporae]RMB12003.1 NAD(P)-dependent dehydrogenase (short-subunit alcohol dehydrogenase family) [Eilatimonas milleporae]
MGSTHNHTGGSRATHPEPAGAALVTGAGQRIGRHIAEMLADRGWAVAVHVNRSRDAGDALVADITDRGGQAVCLTADLSATPEAAGAPADPVGPDTVPGLVAQAANALARPVSLLVNNASLFEDDHVGALTAGGFQRHMAVNALAPALLTQAMAAQLPDNMDGNVINLIDQRVWRLNPTYVSYTASKAALWTLTRTLAQALAPRIRVNGIGPGPTLQNVHQDAALFAREAANVPLGHGPSLDEIARTVCFLIETPSLTGQMIALDGGQHLSWQTPDFVGA